MKNVLQIPSDVGQHCRQAALALESSRRFLNQRIEDARETSARLGDPEWPVMFDTADTARTRDNLAQAAQFLDWLAQHAVHGKPIERTDDAEADHVGA